MLHHQHSHPQLGHMNSYSHLDYSDFPPHGSLHEELEDSPEILSRPRLTKEQVDVLETQFRSHPKPNSNVKRQLAIQTKLTLPRVAVRKSAPHHLTQLTGKQNWFQNRRAKAKQQKKQEEFEILQTIGAGETWNSESIPPRHPYPQSAVDKPSEAATIMPQDEDEDAEVQATANATLSRSTSAQEASWASLQRALASAQAARTQHFSANDSYGSHSTLESPQQASEITSSMDGSQFPSSTFSDWTNPSSAEWMSSSQLSSSHSDQQFDFHSLNVHQLSAEQYSGSEPQLVFQPSPENVSSASAASEHGHEEWSQNLSTPTLATPRGQNVDDVLLSQSMPAPAYPSDRRGSSQEDLTVSLGNIGIRHMTSTPPTGHNTSPSMFSRRDNSVDIAARRKKPRPAMLGTAALRSRSYGAPPSHSPTIHYGPVPTHPLRHVKSTGNNLNVHYSGIRKANSAPKSPLNISTFAEAEALNTVMASTPSLECRTSSAPPQHASLSPEQHPGIAMPATATLVEDANEGHAFGPYTHIDTASPPATPFKTDHFSQYVSMPPPISAPQYAVFPEYTPPYSAGPLTAGSWSDAPLTSPDHLSFSQGVPHYISPMIHDIGSVTNFSQAFSSPPEIRAIDPHKPTEFFIQEFPQQKEAHAAAAQQMSSLKPKSYVFANATATDFTGSEFAE